MQATNAGTRVGMMKQQSEDVADYVKKLGAQLPLLRVPIGQHKDTLDNLKKMREAIQDQLKKVKDGLDALPTDTGKYTFFL